MGRAESRWPGCSRTLAAALASGPEDCVCKSIMPALGNLRTSWEKKSPQSQRELDKAITGACARMSARSLRKRGYPISNKRARAMRFEQLQKAKKKKKVTGRNVGRPSKVDNPKLIQAVESLLEENSVAAAKTCVIKQKQADGEVQKIRKQVRTLSALPSTILRSSPLARKLDERQFRAMLTRHFKQYRKGRRKTDLCDHCLLFRQKIRPRVVAFMRRVEEDMNTALPGYFHPFWKNPMRGLTWYFFSWTCE